jgi:thiamine kinase-like enzyme
VNHGDMYFKNFIANDNLHLIDWNVRISPFFTDLYCLTAQAHEVNADTDEIIKRFCKYSQLQTISKEDIYIGGIISSIQAVFELLIFDCPIEWAEDSYNELQSLIKSLSR